MTFPATLTAQNRALLDKLMINQAIKKFIFFMEPKDFICT
jgi:hypothetical protein